MVFQSLIVQFCWTSIFCSELTDVAPSVVFSCCSPSYFKAIFVFSEMVFWILWLEEWLFELLLSVCYLSIKDGWGWETQENGPALPTTATAQGSRSPKFFFSPHFDAGFELQQVVFTTPRWSNALSRCHMTGWLVILYKSKLLCH